MSDNLRKRLTDHLLLTLKSSLWEGHARTFAESWADTLLPFVQEEIDSAVAIERYQWRAKALPDRWISLRRLDFISLLETYRERREVYNEDHDDALDHVLAEVDFEPNQDDLDAESYHRKTP